MDQKQRQSTSGSRNIPQNKYESNSQHQTYMPTQYDHSIQHFQTVEEISIENRQQILQQQQMEFIIYKGHGQKRQSFSRPPTSKPGRIEKTQRTTLDDNSSNFMMNTTQNVGRVPLSIKQTTTALHIKNISKIPSTDTTQINQQEFNYSKQTKGFPVFQGKENLYQESNKSRSRASNERHKDLTLDFKTLDKGQANTCNNTYIEMFPDSGCRNQTLLNMSKDSNNTFQIQQKPCATQRASSRTNYNQGENPQLQTLNIPQHLKTIGKDSANRDRSASKIKLNTRQFVKNVIQSQIFDLTYKDQVFSKNLKSFITESENFLQNNEKHYRIKYVMDLVQALISSIQSYIEDKSKNDRVGLERQALLKEKEKFHKKMQKHKVQEADLKDKMADFENVFSILTDLRLTFDEDKKEFITAYVKKYKQTLFANNIEKNREEMQMEDERSIFMREVEKIKQKESFANEEIKRIKKEQSKLSEDVQGFIQIKEQFDKQNSMKHDQYSKMKQQIEEKLQIFEKETKEKETYFKKYEAELKQREKILTDLILNNQTDSCQGENLMMSFNKTLNPTNSIDESYKQLDFDHFLGQFESHKDELILREQALSKFLNRNDSKRTSYAQESKGKTGFQMTGTSKPVQPEDDWELVGNPDVYLDQLPQPFKFINNCLDLLIMKPVFNQITLIEDKKKTTEYEGYLKEVMATGFMDLEGVTTITQTQIASGAGGMLDKEGYPSISNKVIIGDKFGAIHLFDVTRKLILDKKLLFEANSPRRILNISTSTILWVDSKLTYISVIARGSPCVKIVCFKHNENKMHLMYKINMCPHLQNPDQLELNHEQSYLELPCESKISLDCLFLTVTSFNGEIKVLKMPPIFNPLKDDEPVQPPPVQTLQPIGGKPVQQPPSQLQYNNNTSSQTNLLGEVIKAEIDNIPTQNIELTTLLISKIDPKKEQRFKDPYAYPLLQEQAPVDAPPVAKPHETKASVNKGHEQNQPVVHQQEHHQEPHPLLDRNQIQYNFKYQLGQKVQDLDGGDAGTLLKKVKYFPQVFFIRSAYCGKTAQPHIAETSSRQIKQYFITTGIAIAYLNTFDIQIYNLQKPVKENVPWDYSQEYFNKIITTRKLNAKKKPEKSLAALIKTTRQKEEAVERAKNQNQLAQEMFLLKESMIRPVRTFRMPYNISCVAFQGTEDNYQSLAVGLFDGAVIIIDLILGIEKQFLEKHPSEITSLSFWEEKVLMSGSVDGRINLNDLEVDEQGNQKMNRCQNCQDRRIPVAKVITSSEYGIGVGVDIEGNCRFYDLIRFKKIAKISSHNQRDTGESRFLTGTSKCKWRLVPNIAYEVAQDAFLAITQLSQVQIQESYKQEGESTHLQERKYLSEKDLLIDNKYSDKRENLKSLNAICRDTPELPFYLQKSTLCIFRFEDVILNIYPHLASLKRKGMTIKEIFLKNDPQKETLTVAQSQQPQNFLGDKSKMGGDDSHADSRKNIAAKSVISGNSNRKSEHFSVNFNLAPMGGQSVNNSQLKQEYEFPTLKRLNPELYKEQAKQQNQMKDPVFQSVLHIKERYGYHEMRMQRIQKRGEDIGKELEAKNQEDILKNRKQNMGSSSRHT